MKKFIIILFTVGLLFTSLQPAIAAFLYKNYIIREDSGTEILCDPYIVQKDDWVLKLFRGRGQIADQDFPEFLNIFGRLNPSIEDVDKILPGQYILIPLKKLDKAALPGQSTGMVTIPFVTVTKTAEVIEKSTTVYTVRQGDTISAIVSETFKDKGVLSYRESMLLFKSMNPELTDINRIYPGQNLNIPKSTIHGRQLYDSLMASGGTFPADQLPAPDRQILLNPPDSSAERYQYSAFFTAASILNGKLVSSGNHHFPGSSQKNPVLDFSLNPMIELQDGTRVIIEDQNVIAAEDKALMQSHWSDLKFVNLPLQSTFDQIMNAVIDYDEEAQLYQNLVFSDNGVKIRIQGKWVVKSRSGLENEDAKLIGNPPLTFISIVYPYDQPMSGALKQYLAGFNILIKEISPEGKTLAAQQNIKGLSEIEKKIIYAADNRDLIREFTKELGFQFTEKTDISFPYAGIQVNASSNLISTPEGSHLLVDFGDLYGEALSSIRSTGVPIVQFNPSSTQDFIVGEIFRQLDIKHRTSYQTTPVNRRENLQIHMEIPGSIFNKPTKENYLITSVMLDDHLIRFISEQGYKTLILYKPNPPPSDAGLKTTTSFTGSI